jgi:hypothetical protein
MLALGGRALRHRAIGLGRARRGGRGLEAVDIAAGGKREGCAQHHGRSPKPAAYPSLAPSRTIHHVASLNLAGGLIPAKQFDLPHPEHFHSRAAARLNVAAHANPPIFERLGNDAGRLENS